MSTLQVANLHFESTGNNRLQYTGSNAYNLVAAGVTAATINSTAVAFPLNLSINNISSNTFSANGSTGTSGQTLLSGGSSSNIYWGTLSGRLTRAPQILTSGTSYTTPANCTSIYVEAVGAGGGGGGSDGSVSDAQSGGGGGSGGYCAKYFTVTPSTAYSYVIGAGGAGGSGVAIGANGGATTFTVSGVTITANGGIGGDPGNSKQIGLGGLGGNATGGDLNVIGNPGGTGTGGSSSNTATDLKFSGGHGGSSYFGGAGRGDRSQDAQDTAGTTGSGGGGAASHQTTIAYVGSNGGNGIIRIWEYA
jgi:hypothetical protein